MLNFITQTAFHELIFISERVLFHVLSGVMRMLRESFYSLSIKNELRTTLANVQQST